MGNKRKKDLRNKVRLDMIGSNTTSITGSCIHISFFDKDLDREVNGILEIGISQSGSILENYKSNDTLLGKFDAKNLDFVIIGHFHGDHALLLSGLINRGFRGKIYLTKESASIAPVMLADGQHIGEVECEWLKNKKGIKAKPFYKLSDIDITTGLMEIIQLNEMINISPNIQLKFIGNTHILGSAGTILYFKNINSRVSKLFYSSDLGNSENKYFNCGVQLPTKSATVSIYESTYASREKDINCKKLRKQELIELEKTLEHTLLEKKGSVLFPTFSLQRSPTLLKHLKCIMDNNEKLKNIPIYLDGNLSNNLIDVYEKVCEGQNKIDIDNIIEWDNLTRLRSYKETLRFLDEKTPKIVLASAGFCHTGRVLLWLKELLPKKKNTIVFTGYSSNNSPATKIKNKDVTHQKTIKIDKNTVLMNADVECFYSFSSHIQRRDLINYITSTTSQEVILVHGDVDGKIELAEDISKILNDKGLSTKVTLPKKNQVIYF